MPSFLYQIPSNKKAKMLPGKPNLKPLNSAWLKLKLIFHASETMSRI
jgi:hypothetical protein